MNEDHGFAGAVQDHFCENAALVAKARLMIEGTGQQTLAVGAELKDDNFAQDLFAGAGGTQLP